LKLTKQEQDIVRRKFCVYCIKVLDGEAKNYRKELEKQREREVNFSELLQEEWMQLVWYDDYPETDSFQVMDKKVSVKNADISDALSKLPERKRMIVLMTYFLDMTEKEIAEYLNLVQSTVHYHKADSLRLLKKWME
jgi:RNA polymerase sigma factor (sigma-70 family)